MKEFEKGYELGSKISREECKKTIQEWEKLEKDAIPLLTKPYAKMTEEEKKLD